MPQVTLESLGLSAPIIVEIPNKKRGETEWKRKEQVQKLEYQPATKTTFIHTLIIPYEKLEGDVYGEPINNEVIIEESFQIADNTTIVDLTGTILAKNAPIEASVEQLEAMYPQLVGVNWMKEGDFFCMVAQTQQVLVNPYIASKVAAKYTTTTTTTTIDESTTTTTTII